MGNCFGQGGGGAKNATAANNGAGGGAGAEAATPAASSKGAPQAILDSSSGKAFGEVYKMGDKLGEGAFSVVKKGSHRQTQKMYAIKIVTKSKLTKEDEVALKDEIEILTKLEHNHIIRLFDTFEEPQYYYLVTEILEGGELFDRIVSKAYYNEKEARDVCKILFEAMAYCHSKQIAHRDLKPENLLLVSTTNDSEIKIADFGFAKKAPNEACLRTQCGTPGYVAPEILEGVPYGVKADMWSLGVIVYILLGGYPPFVEQNQRELFRKIRKGQFEFHEEYWGCVSAQAKDLISALLTVKSTGRLSADGTLKNAWVTEGADNLIGKDLGKNLIELRKFNGKRKFRAAIHALVLANKLEALNLETKQRVAEGKM